MRGLLLNTVHSAISEQVDSNYTNLISQDALREYI